MGRRVAFLPLSPSATVFRARRRSLLPRSGAVRGSSSAARIGIAFVFVLLQWADRYLVFHAVFFLLGLATGSFSPAMIPIISETYDSRHWGKVLGLYDSAASSSVFAVPLLVTFGLHFLPWRILVLVLAMAVFLLPIGFWKTAIEPKPTVSFQRGHTFDLLKKRSVWVMALLWVAASASYSGLFSILPLFLIKERGLPFDYANTLIGISRASGLFVSIASGFLVDRYGYSPKSDDIQSPEHRTKYHRPCPGSKPCNLNDCSDPSSHCLQCLLPSRPSLQFLT